MWLAVILGLAHAAPQFDSVFGWVGDTLLVGAEETVYYLPEGGDPLDQAGLKTESWRLKCILPPDGPPRCWDEGGPHQADGSTVQCVAPADETRLCLDPGRIHEGKRTLGSREDWDAWSEQNPLSIGSDLSRVGDKSFGVIWPTEESGELEEVAGAAEIAVESKRSTPYHVQLMRGDLTWTWAFTGNVKAGEERPKTFHVSPYWSADGQRLAVLEREQGDDEALVTLRVHQASTALLTVLAHRAHSPQASEEACKAVASGAGLVFQLPIFGKRAVDHSVVYYAEGFGEQAELAAAAVPGGASVEPLSWTTHSAHDSYEDCQHFCGQPDLLLELGASANAPLQPLEKPELNMPIESGLEVSEKRSSKPRKPRKRESP